MNILIIICLVFTFSSVIAKEQFVIKPILQVSWQRDSNFHRSETNEKTVDSYTIRPQIDLSYTTGKSFVSLSYWFKVFRYDDQDENLPGQIDADELDYTAHNAQFKAHTQATRRLRLGVDNTFLKTRDPARADERSNVVDQFKYNLNRFSPKLDYKFGEKFGLGLTYTNLLTDYSDDAPGEGEDSTENRGNITWFYYFTPKTFFDLDYQYWERDYDQNSADYDSNQVTVNV
ncbi:MAG: porin family protein, partial [Desulfobacteraceae bacterium]|nr:porin family protein [Desulfobacteraceae bacterium]